MLDYLEETKTDTELHNAAMKEWAGVLAQLWDAYDKPLDANRLKLYKRQFSIIPLGLLERAVDRAIREHSKYNSVPTVGNVWGAVEKELKKDGIFVETIESMEEAIEQWTDRLASQVFIRFE